MIFLLFLFLFLVKQVCNSNQVCIDLYLEYREWCLDLENDDKLF